MKIDQINVNYHGNAEFSLTLKEGDHTLLHSDVVKLKKGQWMETDVSGIGFDKDDTELKRLCTEYGVYLRSDEYDKCHTMKIMQFQEDITNAAMRMYFTGYPELIECLEDENGN